MAAVVAVVVTKSVVSCGGSVVAMIRNTSTRLAGQLVGPERKLLFFVLTGPWSS